MDITLEDLSLAYRKAKVDLYYSSNCSLQSIADYENNLIANLQSLLDRLNGESEDWIENEDFLGGWTYVPKSISFQEKRVVGNGLVFSSPEKEWHQICEREKSNELGKKPEAEFRLMSQASLDFHVLSTLWIQKIGYQYDSKLGLCAYGNRVRCTQNGEINPLSMGSFKPYLRPFREWRDGGIDAMRKALEANKRVVALTADVSSFYHELNPDFMLHKKFNQMLDLNFSLEESKLHRLFIRALQLWAKRTPLGKGIPVGLPASAVVANLALIELDRLIQAEIIPLYYGRYVDDILLVMENGANFGSTAELWEWIFKRLDGRIGWKNEEKQTIQFKTNYLIGSNVSFSNEKNKVFLLEGNAGKALIDSIAHQIHERASEWRSLPNLSRLNGHIATDLLAVTQTDGQAADNLRKADLLTMRRAAFAIRLRDFEAYERDLFPNDWEKHRHAFLNAFVQHVLVLPQFFELAIYVPRVIRLATACGDFEYLNQIIQGLERLCKSVESDCNIVIKSCPIDAIPEVGTTIDIWKERMFADVLESVSAAFPPELSDTGMQAWRKHIENYPFDLFGIGIDLSVHYLQAQQRDLFSHDLAHMPFRFIGFPKEMIAQRGIPKKGAVKSFDGANFLLPRRMLEGVSELVSLTKLQRKYPYGFLFSTRPFRLAELYVLLRDPFSPSRQKTLQLVMYALRGFSLAAEMPSFDSKGVLQIPYKTDRSKLAIAVSSWQSEYESWVASVSQFPDPDVQRYARLTALVNNIIATPKGATYFILPELSVPAHWFMRIAGKLQGRGISLIAGIEYLHAGKRRVRNQVWAALSHDGLGFPSMLVYQQDKQRPALHEEHELQRIAGVKVSPQITWMTPPILQHGNFRFALLICSELTNISYRTALRGQIDALFVPEWNQDTESFNALVESAAMDIHAYIIQCNDRQHGDSRIRGPYKDNWRRDVLRVKGGITDYCVIGEIDVCGLRQFQSAFRSPSGPYKPVPDGFTMSEKRKLLPM